MAAVVTGGGKTMLAMACIQSVADDRPDATFIVVVPTLALLDQWMISLTDDLSVDSSEIASYGAGKAPRRFRRVNLMVLNTARRWAPKIAEHGLAMLVVDECHRAASPENAKALQGPHIATLGLSATPERDFDDLFDEVVVPALGPVIYRYSYREARRDKVIAPFEMINIEVKMTADEQDRYDQLTRKIARSFSSAKNPPEQDEYLRRLLRERARVANGASQRIPVAVRLVDRHRRDGVIVFHEQIDAANILAQVLADQGHRVAVYHSGLSPGVRQDNLRMFRKGLVDVLVTCRALDEGFNVPNASVGVIVASTASTRQRVQRLGRVLRPAPGKRLASVYTLYASEPESHRLRLEAESENGADAVRWWKIGDR